MKKNVRLNLTNDEKLAREIVGKESEALHFKMSEENDINNIISKEKANTFNEHVTEYIEKVNKQQELLKQYTDNIKESMNSTEIKPMMTRVLIKPFDINPFQQIKISKAGVITDAGDLTPEQFNNDTGKWEEMQRAIVVGAVYDVGPCCKYLKPGDVVYFQRTAMVPVPFFKQGLITVSETQVIAVVNEGLTERFNNIEE